MCKYRWGRQDGFNYHQKMFELQKAVIVFNNSTKVNTFLTIFKSIFI